MRRVTVLCFLAIWAILAVSPAAAQPGDDLPTGTIAQGQIEPVPGGDLVVGVIDHTLPVGGNVSVGGPPGFLLNDSVTVEIAEIEGGKKLGRGEALFLPGGRDYVVANMGDRPARVRFVGLGSRGELKGATYEMLPVPWGPGAGEAYYVTLSRSYFNGGSATGWHYHSGPAFGILDDGGAWENRQQDGSTRRIPTPGYYVQPALDHHQLAQVGSGGNALIFQFAPPGQGLTGGSDPRGDSTPTVLTLATPISAGTALPVDEATASASPAPTPAPPADVAANDPQVGAWALAATLLAGVLAAALWRLGRRR